MKRLTAVLWVVLAVQTAPAHALFGDEAILSMQYAEDKTYHAFMQLQIVQEIATLKANYDASVRYVNEFKQLNSGKGLLQNVAVRIETAQQRMNDSFKAQLEQTWTQGGGQSTMKVDQFFHSLDQAVAGNIRYAGEEAANIISNRKLGESIASDADGLSPKDAANLSAKAQGIQIQMIAQTHEDNLRIIQLLSMQLAGQARQQGSESRAIDSLRRSVKSRAPGYQEPVQDQGGDQ